MRVFKFIDSSVIHMQQCSSKIAFAIDETMNEETLLFSQVNNFSFSV